MLLSSHYKYRFEKECILSLTQQLLLLKEPT